MTRNKSIALPSPTFSNIIHHNLFCIYALCITFLLHISCSLYFPRQSYAFFKSQHVNEHPKTQLALIPFPCRNLMPNSMLLLQLVLLCTSINFFCYVSSLHYETIYCFKSESVSLPFLFTILSVVQHLLSKLQITNIIKCPTNSL